MKKRRGGILQKMMAVLLSAALLVGMIQSAFPTEVLAKENREFLENTGMQESVSGNGAEKTEPEDIEIAEPKDAAGDDAVSANMLSDEPETAAAVTAVPGIITADEMWDAQTLCAGTYTINPGVTVTITGMLTVADDVLINGGGKLVRGDGAACFTVSGGSLTLQNVEIDGASLVSTNSMITANGGAQVTLGEGCRMHHCYKDSTSQGAVLNLSQGNAVFQNAVIENCQASSYGGAIYMTAGSSLAIYGGTYRDNHTISTTSYGGGFIYNRASKLEIYDGSFINNTSGGRGGCIYNAGISGTETHLYGGYFQGNRSNYTGSSGKGSGAVFYSSENTAATIINLSGNVRFCGDGVAGSGVDGVFLGFASNAARKAQISSELKYPIALYLEAEEGRIIAQGVGGYILQKKDMKKISFTDVGSSGTVWYAKLDEENNQVILTTTKPDYHFYMTYAANGGMGDVSDGREYDSDDTVTVQPGDGLQRDGYSFGGWNTQPDGTGTAYQAGDTFQITDDVTLYAQWIADFGKRVTYDYSTNGGSSATQSAAEVRTGEDIDLTPGAVKSGWEFVGWNTNKDAHVGITSLTMGNSDVTLYAIYKRTLSASFYSGSAGSMEKLTTTIYNRDVQGSVLAPALKAWTETAESGYEAVDWQFGNRNQAYAPGDAVMLTENASFYGRYSKTIKISYHANGGTGSVAEQTAAVKVVVNNRNAEYEEVSILLKDGTGLSRAGYTFGGWYDNADCTGTEVTGISGRVTGNREYYAKWTDDIAPVIGTLEYSYQPKNLWHQLIGKESLVITVPVTEEGSGADEIVYTVMPDGGVETEHRTAIRNGLAKITVPTDFKGEIAISCADRAGNTSAGITVGAGLNATGIIIEDKAPQIQFRANNQELSSEEYDSSPDITVTVTDDKDNAISAGIAAVTYQIGNGQEIAVQQDFTAALTTGSSFVIPAGKIPVGKTIITVTAADNAGNRNTVTQTVWVHSHSYGTEWKVDRLNHWHECVCGEKSETAAHNFGEWITDKGATETEEGEKHRTCQTCSYEEKEVIPTLGIVDKDVQIDDNVPDIQIAASAGELADMLLTEDEKMQVAGGTNIRIIFKVKDASESVSNEDKALVEAALDSYAIGQYLDISLYKLMGEKRTDINKTPKKLMITIAVPDSLKNTDNKNTRTFAVIRVHDNQTELLADLDSNTDTITIETDRFSTYAIVYKDAVNGGSDKEDDGSKDDDSNVDKDDSQDNGSKDDKNDGGGSHDNSNGNNNSNNNSGSSNNNSPGSAGSKHGSTKDNEPKTGDAAPLELYATLAMIAGFAYLRLYFADGGMGMTEETKKELVLRLVVWAKQGGRCRKYLALAAIFVLLVYYHAIGKKLSKNLTAEISL